MRAEASGGRQTNQIGDIETPEVLVDREKLLANLDRAQGIATRHSVRLRPHIKTHKSVEIARLQLARGAVGITASKPDEALVFIESGAIKSVTLAYPIIDERKLQRVFAAATRRDVDVRVTIDSGTGVAAASAAVKKLGGKIGAFVKIDVGLHRCGLRETSPQVIALVEQINRSPALEFAGLLAHAGHAYAAKNVPEIAAIAAEECAILARVRHAIESSGTPVPEVSVGSTPSVLASTTFDGITEIRPGNYAFLDATAVRLGLAAIEDVALTVLATIVSANDQHLIIDAGSKVLSSDSGAHGTRAPGYGIALPFDGNAETSLNVSRLSEEHGFIERGDSRLQIGAKVRIVPNHACPVANLAERLTIVRGNKVVDQWAVDARAKVR